MNQPALEMFTQGQTSTAGDELAMRLTTTRNECLSLIRQGTMFTSILVGTGAALAVGRIDPAKAKIMAESLVDVPGEVAMAVEDLVLPKAPDRTPGQVRSDVAKALISVDPAQAQARAQRRARSRKVTRPRTLPDGEASVWVSGPADQVLTLDVALDGAARAARTAGDPRTLDQLRFDILTDVGALALAGGRFPGTDTDLASNGGRRPEIHVTVALEHLLAADGSGNAGPGADRGAQPCPDGAIGTGEALGVGRRPWSGRGGRAEQIHDTHPSPPKTSIDPETVPILTGYVPITPTAARAIAAGGIWRRLVTDPLTHAVLDLGHTRYRPTQELADHIVARDRTCVGPGCSRPASGCDLDHTVAWIHSPEGADEPGDAAGGTTSEDNLGPMCTREHLIKTHGGFRVEQAEPGLFEWTTPAGLRYRRERDGTRTFLGHVVYGTLHPPRPPDAPPPF
ncbi:DUF222 domain-containing protein [Occultella glacieicola]|uniref:DUF222 domain-containing protein n=2 Tax=Occultella glacieicola TaxID=2518684 RepID=A0ABY2E883_9MICO|nr:DUF222 domain-containing protein [Occultella glacieicola]